MYPLLTNYLQLLPKCKSIQEQVHPSQPFHSDFIFTYEGSYFQPHGDYKSGLSVVGSKIQLTCLYKTGKVDYIKRFHTLACFKSLERESIFIMRR